MFFIVSGFLVTRSVLTQPTLVSYTTARVLRLFPALIVVCIFLAFVLGPLVTAVAWQTYFTDPRVWLYVPVAASLLSYTMTLPGVFETVPVSGAIDNPLWTLRYEAATCYSHCSRWLACWRRGSALDLLLSLIFAGYAVVTYANRLARRKRGARQHEPLRLRLLPGRRLLHSYG